jgi:hypothetical protein
MIHRHPDLPDGCGIGGLWRLIFIKGIPRVRRDTMPGVLAQAMAQREHATVYHVRSPCDLEAVLRDARRYVGG